MPSIHYMNAPSHPFWDFVQDMNNRPSRGGPQPTSQDETPRAGAETGQEHNTQNPSAEDPPEVDPSTVRPENRDMPFRGRRGHFGRERHSPEGGRERRCGREGGRPHGFGSRRGGWGFFGPPPFAFGESAFGQHEQHGLPPFVAGDPASGPPPPGSEPRGPPPPGFEHHGRGGHRHRGGPGHHHGPPHEFRGHHDPHEFRRPHGRRGRHGPRGPSFDLRQFLSDLGQRIGMDLQGVAEGVGLERFMNPANVDTETDFEPKADIFDQEKQYTIHVSLPGAKKEDVGVDWDGEHSVLRVAGVVHRPGVDESMLEQLVVDGRNSEVGVFEKTIKLGTREEPASIDVAGIKAKMTDGVLIIRVPKVEVEHKKRDVPISNSETPSPQRSTTNTIFDADREIEMHDAEIDVIETPSQTLQTEKGKSKEAEHQPEKQAQASASVLDEPLPVYEADQHDNRSATVDQPNDNEWEHDGSEDEGEYVKINVD
jgi:HSP20 family protein